MYQDHATQDNSFGCIQRHLLAISSDKTRQADMFWTWCTPPVWRYSAQRMSRAPLETAEQGGTGRTRSGIIATLLFFLPVSSFICARVAALNSRPS